jgi:hypothetical protein
VGEHAEQGGGSEKICAWDWSAVERASGEERQGTGGGGGGPHLKEERRCSGGPDHQEERQHSEDLDRSG